jgi:hypothetical protein
MPAARETATFDYGVPAELFMAKRKARARQPLSYRRFATAAEAKLTRSHSLMDASWMNAR